MFDDDLAGWKPPSQPVDEKPDGARSDWSRLYDQVHAHHQGDAWMVGRVTMAEISKAGPHAPASAGHLARPHHVARTDAGSYAIAIDPSGKLHFDGSDLYGDHVIVLLGQDVPENHLAELAGDGVSYIVAATRELDVGAMLETLNALFGIKRILLEGGAAISGSLLAEGLVDELSFIVAPALEARRGSDRVVEFGEEGLADKIELSLIAAETLGHGAVHLRYKVSRPA